MPNAEAKVAAEWVNRQFCLTNYPAGCVNNRFAELSFTHLAGSWQPEKGFSWEKYCGRPLLYRSSPSQFRPPA
jgi:hypothetical protein